MTAKLTTADLTVGDVVTFAGMPATVVELRDLARPAAFGTGNEWQITLDTALGLRDMAAAASHKWTRA